MEPENLEGEANLLAEDTQVVAEVDPFEQLLDADSPPEWAQALEAERGPTGTFKVPRLDPATTPPDVLKTVLNLRGLAQSKANEAAKARADFEARSKALEQREAELAVEREKFLGVFKNQGLQELIDQQLGAEPDPYKDPAGYAAWHGRKAAQEQVQAVFGKLGTVSEEAKAAAQAALEQRSMAAREAEVEAFIAATPDFEQHADAVADLVQKHGMTIEMGYQYARALAQAQAAPAPGAPARQVDPRAAMRAPGPGNRAPVLPPTPKGMDSHDLENWYQANPGTRERDYQDYVRRYEAGLTA